MYLIIDAYDEILSEERRMEIVSLLRLHRNLPMPSNYNVSKINESELTNFLTK